MTAAAVVSLRGLPMMAKEGLTMWFHIGFATLFFLIPGALVSAELGGMFNKDKGGVYTWVKEALGAKWGFAAVWLQWIQNVVWYPVAVASIIPMKQLSLTAGIMQAFKELLDIFGLSWMVPVAAAFLAAGALGQIITWVGGPSRALLQTAEEGEIPPSFAKRNKGGQPVSILILQAVIVTVLGSFYLIFPNPSAAFYLLSAMTVSLYLVMYAAAIKLRYSRLTPSVTLRCRAASWACG